MFWPFLNQCPCLFDMEFEEQMGMGIAPLQMGMGVAPLQITQFFNWLEMYAHFCRHNITEWLKLKFVFFLNQILSNVFRYV